jgi:protease I
LPYKKKQSESVAVVVADGFEQVEMTEPRKALEEAGAKTELVSPAQKEVQGWNHREKANQFRVDVGLHAAHPEN